MTGDGEKEVGIQDGTMEAFITLKSVNPVPPEGLRIFTVGPFCVETPEGKRLAFDFRTNSYKLVRFADGRVEYQCHLTEFNTDDYEERNQYYGFRREGITAALIASSKLDDIVYTAYVHPGEKTIPMDVIRFCIQDGEGLFEVPGPVLGEYNARCGYLGLRRCGECRNYRHCENFFDRLPDDPECHWYPSRFCEVDGKVSSSAEACSPREALALVEKGIGQLLEFGQFHGVGLEQAKELLEVSRRALAATDPAGGIEGYRDGIKDLEMCEAATKEPWEMRDIPAAGIGIFAKLAEFKDHLLSFFRPLRPDMVSFRLNEKGELWGQLAVEEWVQFSPSGWDERQRANARLMAESRAALPHWIRRAMAAEAGDRPEHLRKALIQKVLQRKDSKDVKDMTPDRYLGMYGYNGDKWTELMRPEEVAEMVSADMNTAPPYDFFDLFLVCTEADYDEGGKAFLEPVTVRHDYWDHRERVMGFTFDGTVLFDMIDDGPPGTRKFVPFGHVKKTTDVEDDDGEQDPGREQDPGMGVCQN